MKLPTTMLIALALVCGTGLTGCKKKTDSQKTNGGKTDNGEDDLHGKGPHGGFIAEPQDHAFRVEIVLHTEGMTLDFYIFNHDDNTPLLAANDEIVLTDLKHEGKKLKDITLKKDPLKGEEDGSSHYQAVDVKELTEDHALNGARFKVTIKGKKEVQVTIKRHEDDDH